MKIEEIKEKVESFLKDTDRDSIHAIIAGKDGNVEKQTLPDAPRRGDLKRAIDGYRDAVDQNRIDWAATVMSSFMGKAEKDEEYEYGNVAEDPDAKEVEAVQIYDGEKKKTLIYERDTFELLHEGEGGMGFLSF